MNYSTSPSPIHITPQAVRWFEQQRPGPDFILYFGMKKMGCAGYEYVLDWQPRTSDMVISQISSLEYTVDPQTHASYQGTEIDILRQNLGTQVVYRNPNVVDYCGCGISMSFDASKKP